MSEYIEIEAETDEEEPAVIHFYTNLPLSGGEGGGEDYDSPAAMAVGSALAQALAAVEGITALRIAGSDLTVWRELEAAEYAIVADVSAVLKDFFL